MADGEGGRGASFWRRLGAAASVCAAAMIGTAAMAENRIDGQRPDAPALAAYGEYAVGVRTIELVDPDRVDILAIDPMGEKPDPLPLYDRPVTVEVWHPAAEGARGSTTTLRAFIRDGKTEVSLEGRAMRGAAPSPDGPFPLVIVSHGYPGNRFLMAHLAENLASKGYVVASIDHADSTYRDQAAFGSTLVNRPLDQKFVLGAMAQLSGAPGFLEGLVDAENAAVVGYSMGGYGAVIFAGGGVTETGVGHVWGAPHGTLAVHRSGSESHAALPDPRVKTAIAIGPWGITRGFWDAETLAGVQIPMLLMAGSIDDISGYDPGVRTIWRGATGVERTLLTFENANHNAAAPYPAPAEGAAVDADLGFAPFEHYADPVWDTLRMNNVAQHFATAWLDWRLKDDAEAATYLDLVPNAIDGVWAMDADGAPTPEHSYWKGFANRTAAGLRLETLAAGE